MRNMQIDKRTDTLFTSTCSLIVAHTGSNVKKKHGNFLRIIKTLASFFLTTSRRIYFVARLGTVQTSVFGCCCCWQLFSGVKIISFVCIRAKKRIRRKEVKHPGKKRVIEGRKRREREQFV